MLYVPALRRAGTERSHTMKRNAKVSTAVIRRLPRYYRHLSELQRAEIGRAHV